MTVVQFPVSTQVGSRFPVVPREGDVRFGKALRPYVRWNINEENAIISTLHRIYGRNRKFDPSTFYDKLISAYPDWQRSELSVKAKIDPFIEKVQRLLAEERARNDRRQCRADNQLLDQQWRAFHQQALATAQQASEKLAAEMKEEMEQAAKEHKEERKRNKKIVKQLQDSLNDLEEKILSLTSENKSLRDNNKYLVDHNKEITIAFQLAIGLVAKKDGTSVEDILKRLRIDNTVVKSEEKKSRGKLKN